MDFIGTIATAIVVGIGGYLVLEDALTAGTLVAFVLYVERFFDPIRELAQRYNTFQAAMAASERIFDLLDTEPDLRDAADAEPLPATPLIYASPQMAIKMESQCLLISIYMSNLDSVLPSSARLGPVKAPSSGC